EMLQRRGTTGPISLGRSMVAFGALPVIMGLMNPYGWHVYTFPFAILAGPTASKDIIEWQPPVFLGTGPFSPGVFWIFLAIQLALGVTALAYERRVRFFDASLAVGTMAMALAARRFIPLYALVSAPLLARDIAVPLARIGQLREQRARALQVCAALLLVCT